VTEEPRHFANAGSQVALGNPERKYCPDRSQVQLGNEQKGRDAIEPTRAFIARAEELIKEKL